jgi:putative oxidoreductase
MTRFDATQPGAARLRTIAAESSIWLERWLAPVVALMIRVVLFRVFFFSGLVKIRDWESTLDLFETEYAVPLLPTELSAIFATASELGAGLLVLVGLATRLAALPLLGIAITIQFVLGAADPVYNRLEHYLWIVLLLSLLANGAGKLSLDYFFKTSPRRQRKLA